ncbi:MAG TPA: RDD family protein [Pirellulales bacterium]|nr:RDD family protein [Pirellulales bacterium]
MSKPPDQLDSRIEIVTPENIAFKYRVAGPFRRLPAYLIDMLIRAGVILVVGYFAVMSWHIGFLVGAALMPYIWFFVDWFYGGFFEAYWNGQTPGKRAMGLRVVSHDGQPIDALQAVLRNVLRAVDALPTFTYQLGLVVAASNKRFQRLGDLASGTMVVVEESPRLYGVAAVTEPEAIRLADLIPVNFEPSRSLARALSVYVERRGGFAWGRRAEIARHLGEPLCERFNLPRQTSHDLLLCAVYYRIFVANKAGERQQAQAAVPPRIAPPPITAGQTRTADVHNLLDQMV